MQQLARQINFTTLPRSARTRGTGKVTRPSPNGLRVVFASLLAGSPLAGSLLAGSLLAASLLAASWLCCGGPTAAAAEPDAADDASPAESVLVVCPERFRETFQPWIDYRRGQGVQVRVIGSAATAEAVQDRIEQVASGWSGYLLIVGDAPAIGRPADPATQVPMHYVPTTVSAKFGSTPTMATDHPYADVNGDGHSDLAVGRIPVDRAQQLHEFIGRIKAYESSGDFSFWRQRVQLVGGVGGFGMLADAAIESVTRMMVTGALPVPVRTSIAYGSPGHLFYPRQRFTDSIAQRYGQGCRFWVYAGHGLVDRLDNVPAGPSGVPVLDSQSISKLKCDPANAPIAVLLCCFTGAIDAGVDSFAERLLMHECGPIAVIAGNRVTMPYGNASLTLGLIDAVYGRAAGQIEPAERLGQAWLSAVHALEQEDRRSDGQLQTMIDAVARLVSPAGSKLGEERSEHAALYGLLGDPLLKLHPPAPVRVASETGFDFGKPVTVTVTSPIDGECVVMLDYPLGKTPGTTSGGDPNEITLAEVAAPVQAGQPRRFTIPLEEDRSGAVLIRVHIAGKETWAAGGTKTNIRPAATR